MASGEGFYKKGTDKAYIAKLMKDGQPAGEYVLIRRVSGRTDGNAAQGVQPTLIYKTKKTDAIIERLSPEELNSSAGLYQYGDLHIELLEELKFTDEQSGDIVDRIIYQKQTYRIVGHTQNRNIEHKDMYFAYVVRKVGNQ
jgi:hypothetical protein